MDQSFRLPLVQGLEPRDETLDKDELSSNILYDKSNKDHTFAVKRPGLNTFIGALGRPEGYYDFQGDPDYYVPWEGTFGSFVYDDIWFGLLPPTYEWIGRWLNNRFVAIGFDNAPGFEEYVVAESLDGSSWEYKASIPNPGLSLGDGRPVNILYTGSEYIFYSGEALLTFATNIDVWRSTDLIVWTYEGSSSEVFYNGFFSDSAPPVNGLFITPFPINNAFPPGTRATILSITSNGTDGVNETLIYPSSNLGLLQDIAGSTYTEYRTFLGETSPGVVAYQTSPDGENFTTVTAAGTSPTFEGTKFSRAKFLNSTWCVTGTNYLYTSTNFLNWTKLSLPGVSFATPVVWDGTKYLILSAGNGYLESTNLINWERKTFPGLVTDFLVTGWLESNGMGATVLFPKFLWNGFYRAESSSNWTVNGLPTYFSPVPNQETI